MDRNEGFLLGACVIKSRLRLRSKEKKTYGSFAAYDPRSSSSSLKLFLFISMIVGSISIFIFYDILE